MVRTSSSHMQELRPGRRRASANTERRPKNRYGKGCRAGRGTPPRAIREARTSAIPCSASKARNSVRAPGQGVRRASEEVFERSVGNQQGRGEQQQARQCQGHTGGLHGRRSRRVGALAALEFSDIHAAGLKRTCDAKLGGLTERRRSAKPPGKSQTAVPFAKVWDRRLAAKVTLIPSPPRVSAQSAVRTRPGGGRLPAISP